MKQTQALITPTQIKVIVLMITTDLPIAGMAEKLCVSSKTIKFHMGRIYKALGTKNRNALTVAWYRKTLSKEALHILDKHVPPVKPEIEFITEKEFLTNIANKIRNRG